MSNEIETFDLTVVENPRTEDGVMVMSNSEVTLRVTPANTFPTVIPGTSVRVTFEFNAKLVAPAEPHVLNK